MAMYTAYLPPDGNLERARIVSDARPLLALVLPSIYLLWNRLWFAFAVYALSAVAIGLSAYFIGDTAALFLSVLPGLFLFVHGPELVAAGLESRGWREAGVLAADDASEAEFRFFAIRFGPKPAAARPAPPPLPAPANMASFGMFPE